MAELSIKRGDVWAINLEVSAGGAAVDFTGSVLSVAITEKPAWESYLAPIIKVSSPSRLTISQQATKTVITGELTALETLLIEARFKSVYFILRDDTEGVTYVAQLTGVI